jgi:hypothetical protein
VAIPSNVADSVLLRTMSIQECKLIGGVDGIQWLLRRILLLCFRVCNIIPVSEACGHLIDVLYDARWVNSMLAGFVLQVYLGWVLGMVLSSVNSSCDCVRSRPMEIVGKSVLATGAILE